LVKAGHMLTDRFHLVFTNVPYLTINKQSDKLQSYNETYYPEARHDLATVILERSMELCSENGTSCLVTPQNWFFLARYNKLREKILKSYSLRLIASLGYNAFQTPLNAAPSLVFISKQHPSHLLEEKENLIKGIDASEGEGHLEKSKNLLLSDVKETSQSSKLLNSGARINFDNEDLEKTRLGSICSALKGSSVGDLSLFVRNFWEISEMDELWEFHQVTSKKTSYYNGKEEIILWEKERGRMFDLAQSVKHINHAAQNWLRGKPNWNKGGIVTVVFNPVVQIATFKRPVY